MQKKNPLSILALACTCLAGTALAQPLERVQAADAKLDCPGIASEQERLDEIIAAGDPNAPSLGKAAAGTAANMGGQVAGAVAAQGSGLFGGLGGLLSKVTGAVAQQQVEERMAPDAAAQQRAVEAKARLSFITKLASAKDCRKDEPGYPGKALTAEQFQALAGGPAAGEVKPFNASAVGAVLNDKIATLDTGGLLEGDLKISDKKVYISEFRVLFEVGGKVSASTRSGYMGGTSYGATHSTIKYTVANLDIAALQALTDQAWADFKARLASEGIRVEDHDAFVAAHGEVYPATEDASTPDKPVYKEENLGYTLRKYLVMAPTGMKLHSRGIAGLGAGNIGKRIDFVKNKLDGLAIGVAVNIADLETSGSGSSILRRDGSSTAAGEGMKVTGPTGALVANGHAEAGSLRMPKGFEVPGNFARFREVGGYDTQKDAVAKSMQLLSALGGVAASKSKTVEMEIDLDGPATTRMALQGLMTFNKALVAKIQAGL
jgi:hypothetical protein